MIGLIFILCLNLGLSQNDVALSLARLYGINRSSTLISRFERMDLSLTNFFKVYPILLKWVKDTETDDGKNKVICILRSDEADCNKLVGGQDDDDNRPASIVRFLFFNISMYNVI